MKKQLLILLVSLSFILQVGCAKTFSTVKGPAFDKDAVVSVISTQTVASNSQYELSWDADRYLVILKNRKTGKIWSNIPYEYVQNGGASANVNSTLSITVVNTANLAWETLRGYTAVIQNGRVYCEKITNGLRIVYYFDKVEISVPVEYILRDDSLEVIVDVQNIGEGINHRLLSVSVAPFFCSADNKNEDSYLFIPSGSGALMYATETGGVSRKYYGEVFGEDIARLSLDYLNDNETVRLPIFGAKNGGDALFCVLEEGAESAFIEAEAGNVRTGYSNVYPTFYIRGYDTFASSHTVAAVLGGNEYTMVSATCSVTNPRLRYFPLEGAEADYNGMAKRYRRYLSDSEVLVKSDEKDSGYGVTILGGAQITSTTLGIPHKSIVAATTFTQANEIIKGLLSLSDIKPDIRLMGFGSSGLNPGKLAGGFTFPSIFGSDKQRIELETSCKLKGISLFTDFDLVRFNSSGGGFSSLTDSAKSPIQRVAEDYPVGTPQRDNKTLLKYRLLRRDKLESAVNKLIQTVNKKKISGISLTTLGSLAYSDFSNPAYAVKGKTQAEVTRQIKKISGEGINVAGAANAYFAAAANTVFDVPIGHGDNLAFDVSIPFYEMVFRGSKPIYGEAVNPSGNIRQSIIKTLSSGANLSFSLISEYNGDLYETDLIYPGMGANKLYACCFADNVELIRETLAKYGEFYKEITGVGIDRYEILPNGVTKTAFDNGVVLFANHRSEKADSPLGELDGYGVKFAKE